MAMLLKGAPAASALDEKTAERIAALKEKGVTPCLAMIRIGEDAGAMSYEKGAMKRCAKLGIEVKNVVLPETAVNADLEAAIIEQNNDASVHGILMFRPLPKGFDENRACELIVPAKDVDGVSSGSSAAVYSGAGDGFAPCTAESCIEMLRHYGVEISGKNAVVVGRSLVIGRPVSMLLLRNNATVTICHSKTPDMAETIRRADIVVAAIGKAEALGGSCFAEGQTVVDVGINFSEEKGKLVGDVDFAAAEPIVGAISPVPLGVGSMTTAVLASHVVTAAEKQSM